MEWIEGYIFLVADRLGGSWHLLAEFEGLVGVFCGLSGGQVAFYFLSFLSVELIFGFKKSVLQH